LERLWLVGNHIEFQRELVLQGLLVAMEEESKDRDLIDFVKRLED
jgi:hypothetical protein